uniref:Uncharacterized protein n=1 Tax=Aegilops tauschii subsp. strangulata TaxID=200361 RepID=A0A453SP60_AEGTS
MLSIMSPLSAPEEQAPSSPLSTPDEPAPCSPEFLVQRSTVSPTVATTEVCDASTSLKNNPVVAPSLKLLCVQKLLNLWCTLEIMG